MPRSGKGQHTSSSPGDEGRSRTAFATTRQFDKSVAGLGKVSAAALFARAQQFEREWRASTSNDDISPGFQFKQLGASPGQYRVCQIYAGADYRVALTFIIGRNQAYWVHAWKKTRMNNRNETELAQARAKAVWDELQRGQK